MRIMIKGGVWKNTEDEILKAAVMKYGKNQWARISSLLVRKSAKQCKARWYEWLDPSIKKTEWTREEDEKLLHLAKLMPTQWRTIAPIVGRTPSQCLERYEKLLDAACVKDENYEPNDDPRKLRPGEIDPNPESKPARPDPVDMDEDEKEMLSEARARLANTRGKKAKRKAREKQLEEARRLASLQKRRELKAAGIDNRQRKRKRRGIDYNAEIPFEKKPPPGFFDVADEARAVEQPKFPTTIEELEGKRRVDVEAQLRKQDMARNKIAQRQDAPSTILQVNKLNDPEAVRKRSKLLLPAPQISDHELEEIAKMGYASDLVSEELAGGTGATRTLLANYAQTPRQGMTPFRTPQRTPGGKADAIMMEAENLARLRESQTPLLGGENPELHPSDFSGVTPKKRDIQTPNPMATPSATPGPMGLTPRIGMTPSNDGYSFGVTPKGTPMRDELHINEDMDIHDSAKFEQRRQAELKRNLRSGLTNLPQPRNEYQIVVQPLPEESEEPEEKIEEDMSDRIAREKAEEEARQQALLRKRSKVLQRELPRPPVASVDLIRNSLMRAGEDKSSFVPPTSIEKADEMIQKELLSLLEHDNAKYPLDEKVVKEKKKGGKRSSSEKSASFIPEIEEFEEDVMKEADLMIKEEVEFLRVAMGHENESFDEFVKAHDACQEDLMYFPTRNAYGLSSVAGNTEKLTALQNEFDNVKGRMDDETKKAQRLEQKIKVLTNGYQMRAAKLSSQIDATFKQMRTSATELECFQALQRQEQLAASSRIKGLLKDISKQKELENLLQRRYGDLVAEQERVQALLQELKTQAQIQEEIAARNRVLELAKEEETKRAHELAQKESEELAARSQAHELEEIAKNEAELNRVSAETVASSEELAISMAIDHPPKEKVDADIRTDASSEGVSGQQVSAMEEDKEVVVEADNHEVSIFDKDPVVAESEDSAIVEVPVEHIENSGIGADETRMADSVMDQMSSVDHIEGGGIGVEEMKNPDSVMDQVPSVEHIENAGIGAEEMISIGQMPGDSGSVVEVSKGEVDVVTANSAMESADSVDVNEEVMGPMPGDSGSVVEVSKGEVNEVVANSALEYADSVDAKEAVIGQMPGDLDSVVEVSKAEANVVAANSSLESEDSVDVNVNEEVMGQMPGDLGGGGVEVSVGEVNAVAATGALECTDSVDLHVEDTAPLEI